VLLAFFIWATALPGRSQQLRFEFAPSTTSIRFTLGDILHTFHGSFQLKQGDVAYSIGTQAVHGALVVDATTGQSGSRMRDRKMHREVLESQRYSEIIFRPDRVNSEVAPAGTSTLEVHGIFSIHGVDHELTMPVQLQILPDYWVADAHFAVPYVKWGMKNPSMFFLRVSQSVEIEIHATGQNHSAAARPH
jgi:polyisoprenoid-binding protein YceI